MSSGERIRLAAELYDEIAQELGATLLRMALLEKRLSAREQDDCVQEVQAIRGELGRTMDRVRTTARRLHIPPAGPNPTNLLDKGDRT